MHLKYTVLVKKEMRKNMKRILCIALSLILLTGCSPQKENKTRKTDTAESYVSGVWLSYSELDAVLKTGDFKNGFDAVVSNCKSRGITDLFVHTRAFCDSIYSSQYFPLRETVKQYDFDVLEYMIEKCHAEGLKFHAWINPYRVRTADGDVSALDEKSPVKQWLTDDDASNDTNAVISNGIYLNPASGEARKLVTDGVREIINNYKVDGIHFDDYFYPTTDPEFDKVSYEAYCDGTEKPLPLDDWRRANVNALISGCFTAVKFTDANIVFSISPAASVSENYSKHYADINTWCESGCIDYIIPQLYFGFNYPTDDFKFENLISDWINVTDNKDVKLMIGLAAYKINTQNEPDREEWQNGVDVIKRQTEICEQNPDIYGHIYFSYSFMFKYL